MTSCIANAQRAFILNDDGDNTIYSIAYCSIRNWRNYYSRISLHYFFVMFTLL